MPVNKYRALFAVSLIAFVAAMPGDAATADKAALVDFQPFVGEWKGVGQLKRGSNQGAWKESTNWAWQFEHDRAALAFQTTDAKYYSDGTLSPGEKAGQFVLVANRVAKVEPAKKAESTPDQFIGTISSEGALILENAMADEAFPARITVRVVAGGDRLVTLYEKKVAGTDRYVRMAEVGLTRKGSSFAKGNNGPECIVTGGYGSIQVEHAGKKYFVCCTGCRDLFNDDPAAAIADYQARIKNDKK